MITIIYLYYVIITMDCLAEEFDSLSLHAKEQHSKIIGNGPIVKYKDVLGYYNENETKISHGIIDNKYHKDTQLILYYNVYQYLDSINQDENFGIHFILNLNNNRIFDDVKNMFELSIKTHDFYDDFCNDFNYKSDLYPFMKDYLYQNIEYDGDKMRYDYDGYHEHEMRKFDQNIDMFKIYCSQICYYSSQEYNIEMTLEKVSLLVPILINPRSFETHEVFD